MKRLLATICLTIAVLLGSAGVGYALPPCPDQRRSTTSPWLNCFGTFTHTTGGKYVGEFRNDKRHGQSTFSFANGDKYVGEGRNGKGNGQGTSIAANGGRYIIDSLSQMPVLPVNVIMSDAK